MDWAAEFKRAVSRLKELAPNLPDRTMPNDEEIKRRFLESVENQKDIAFQSKLQVVKENTAQPLDAMVTKLSAADPRTKDVSRKNRHIPQGASAGSALAASAGASSGVKDPEKGKSGVYLGVHYPKPLYHLLSTKHKKDIAQNKSKYPRPSPSAETI